MDANMVTLFATAGGLFAVLTFIHFFADWLFQSQYEASHKHNDNLVRAKHCTIYTVFFVPFLLLLGMPLWHLFGSIAILWLSHFVIDTYIPVALWARYVRLIPTLVGKPKVPGVHHDSNRELRKWLWTQPVYPRDKEEIFGQLWSQPVYPILFIVVDQILHLVFLWPIVFIIILM